MQNKNFTTATKNTPSLGFNIQESPILSLSQSLSFCLSASLCPQISPIFF